MELKDAISKRHSIRLFTGQAVERSLLEQLVTAAALAPSARNSQPWRLHVATGITRDSVAAVLAMTTSYLEDYLKTLPPEHLSRTEGFFRNMGEAPVIIAVSLPKCDPESLDRLNDLIATGAMLENLLLQATELELGVCSLTFSFWVRDELASVYQVPSDREIVAMVLCGWPLESPTAPEHVIDVATWYE